MPESTPQVAAPNRVQKIIVTDIQMPFMSMVVFMVKWSFASIPAIFIVTTVLTIAFTIIRTSLSMLLGGFVAAVLQ